MSTTDVIILGNHLQGGTALDFVTSVLIFDHNTTLRRIARASSTVDKEARATTHVVAARGIQLVAIRHALKGHHVTKGVSALRKRTHRHLTLTGWIISARTRLARATTSSINLATIITLSPEVMSRLRISVRTSSGSVQLIRLHFFRSGLVHKEHIVSEGDRHTQQKENSNKLFEHFNRYISLIEENIMN